jgi:hypothetical protein
LRLSARKGEHGVVPVAFGKNAGTEKSLLATVPVEPTKGPLIGKGGVWSDLSSVSGGVGGGGAVAGRPPAVVERVTEVGRP